MPNINRVTLAGHIGQDPEIRETRNGQVANMSLATNFMRNGEQQTAWHRLVTFDEKLITLAEAYINKGDPILVEGRIQYGSYEKDGITRYTTDIVVYKIDLLGSNRMTVREPTEEEAETAVPF